MNRQTPHIPPSKTLLFLLGWLFISSTILCQTRIKTDTLVAYQYFKKADSLLTHRQLDSAIVYFKKALPIYQNTKNWERVAGCYNKISYTFWRKKENEKSLVNVTKALNICNTFLPKKTREKGIAYYNLGNYHYNKALYRDITTITLLHEHELDSAMKLYQKSIDILRTISPINHLDISNSYQSIGHIYYFKRKYSKALKNYKKTILIREKKLRPNNISIGKVYFNIGLTHMRMQEYSKAIFFLKKSLAIESIYRGNESVRLPRIHKTIGDSYRKKGENDTALYYYKKYLATMQCLYFDKKPYVFIDALNSIGISYKNRGNYDQALAYYNKAINIQSSVLGVKKKHFSYSYNNIGIVYKYKGEYNKALKHLQKALTSSLQVYKKKHYKIAIRYNNIANIYRLKEEYNEAIRFYTKAIKIRIELFNKNHPDIAESYHDLGLLFVAMQAYEKALDNFTKALTIRTNIYGSSHPEIADSYTSLGDLYFNKKEYPTALMNYQKALVMQQQLFGEQHPKIAASYNNLAQIYIAKKEYQTSLAYYEKAIKANTNPQKQDSTSIDQYFDLNIVLSSLQGKAKVYNLLYAQDHNPDHLAKAIPIYQQADRIIDHIRETFTSYQDKVDFAQKAKDIYKAAIATQLQLHDLQNNQNALTQAFYYAEKSKANTLKELVNGNNAKKVAGLPNTITTLEKDLRIDRAFYQSQITKAYANQKIDTAKITRFENALFTITERQDSLTRVIATHYPKYHKLTYNKELVSLTEIQQRLDDSTTVVEFFTSDSITYAFTVSKQHTKVQKLVTPYLTDQIEKFRKHITSKELQEYKTLGQSLYTQLLAPIKNQLVGDQLIIIPDGALWHLNFELLLTQNTTSNNPIKLPYLLKDFAISYANAANLLFARNKNKPINDQKRQECLAFSFSDSTQMANSTSDKAMRLATLRDLGDDLPGTRKEIKAISNIIDGQYYYGSQAIEANFKKNAGAYNILHLALHGDVDHKHPQNSKLYFTKTKDTIEDNLLYGHELFAMDIPAELTVLSACNTGSGTIAKGEGIMSLGSAFQYAGTKSLLLSSWEVSDNTTPELMQYFYTHLKAGMNKAKALQQAKLDYLETANIHRTQPVYWAGFYLVGDPAPIHFENNTEWYWLLGFGSVLVLVLIVFWYRRKHTSTVPVLSLSKGSA